MLSNWSKISSNAAAILNGYGGENGIYVRPSIVKMLGGDGNGAIFLHHLLYWSKSDAAREQDGWFFMTTQKVTKETGLNRAVQERVRTKLGQMGILEHKRQGMPAKNYFRIDLERLVQWLDGQAERDQKSASSLQESSEQDGVNQANIVNKEVDILENYSLPTSENSNSAAPKMPTINHRRAKINVLGDKYDDFLNWVVQTYPVSIHGIRPTDAQARKIADKLGDTFSDGKVPDADKAIKEFVRGLKNFAAAVNSGRYPRQYVPKFEKFAGLGVMYGQEPKYKEWAGQVEAPQEQRKIIL